MFERDKNGIFLVASNLDLNMLVACGLIHTQDYYYVYYTIMLLSIEFTSDQTVNPAGM